MKKSMSIIAILFFFLVGCHSETNLPSSNLIGESSASPPPSLTSEYNGTWYGPHYVENVGGEKLDLKFIDSNVALITIDDATQNFTRMVEVNSKVTFSKDGIGTFSFDTDGWGTQGQGSVQLKDGKVIVSIHHTYESTLTDFRIFEDTREFTKTKPTNPVSLTTPTPAPIGDFTPFNGDWNGPNNFDMTLSFSSTNTANINLSMISGYRMNSASFVVLFSPNGTGDFSFVDSLNNQFSSGTMILSGSSIELKFSSGLQGDFIFFRKGQYQFDNYEGMWRQSGGDDVLWIQSVGSNKVWLNIWHGKPTYSKSYDPKKNGSNPTHSDAQLTVTLDSKGRGTFSSFSGGTAFGDTIKGSIQLENGKVHVTIYSMKKYIGLKGHMFDGEETFISAH